MPYTFKHGDRPLEGITVQRTVGRGGFGEVYYALTDSGKQVALKYLRENPEIELRGIGHVMNLKSPHLITIYDVKRNAAGDPFVIMEYVGGPSLRELLLASPNGLGTQKAAFFLSGIAKGLSYLHERGIVHRDLKPANIFYDDGYVKIGDYGLSKHISVSRHSGQTVSVGTVHYMAPEIGSGNYTKAIDIYALGVILFEMLTGRLPFSGASTAEILMRHLRDNPDLSGVPTPFAGVIARALAKEPTERYQSADAMVEAVLESAEISRSVELFDHSALTQVPRLPEASDADATVTSPHRPPPVPPLDVHDLGLPRLPAAAQALPPRLQHKLDHLTRKLEQKAVKLERKYGVPVGKRPTSPRPPGTPRANRRAQVVILLAVTAALAAVLGALTMDRGPVESRIMVAAFFLAGGTIGPLLAHFRVLLRSPTRSTFIDRLVYASAGALFMVMAAVLASDEVDRRLATMIVAPLAMLLLCDWGRRIETGRRGQVAGRDAFWPAVIGLVAAHIVDAGDYGWTAAGICAGITLLTQAAAALWPHPQPAGFPAASPKGAAPPTCPADSAAPFQPAVGAATPTAAEEPLPPDARAPGVAANVAPTGALPRVAQIPRNGAVRTVFGVLATGWLAVTLGVFFALVVGQPDDSDIRAGLLFATLAGVAWLPFLLTKALQRYKASVWRSTLRMLVVSLGMTLTGGMITCLAYGDLDHDEVAGAIFGLVVGSVIALAALCVRGRAGRAARPKSSVPACASMCGYGGSEGAARLIDQPGIRGASEPPPPVLVTATQPSFAGRATSAGTAFLGKILLLAGLILAVAQSPLRDYARGAVDSGELQVGRGAQRLIDHGVPPGYTLAALGAGSLLLVLARRKEGPSHFLRACLGCAFLLWSGLLAMLWASQPLRILLAGGNLPALQAPEMWGPLFATGLSLVVGIFLLLWPNVQRQRPIVI